MIAPDCQDCGAKGQIREIATDETRCLDCFRAWQTPVNLRALFRQIASTVALTSPSVLGTAAGERDGGVSGAVARSTRPTADVAHNGHHPPPCAPATVPFRE